MRGNVENKNNNPVNIQWRSKAKCRPGPTIKVPPFSPLKFPYKNFEWKFIFRANLEMYGLIKHL